MDLADSDSHGGVEYIRAVRDALCGRARKGPHLGARQLARFRARVLQAAPLQPSTDGVE